jgi:hypothetical protein
LGWPYLVSKGSDMSVGGAAGMAIFLQDGNHLFSRVPMQSCKDGAMVATIGASLGLTVVWSRHWRAAASIQATAQLVQQKAAGQHNWLPARGKRIK